MNTCRFLSILVLGLGLIAPASAERLVIKGSNTFGEKLGPKLIEDFKKTHEGWEIELESHSTGYGIQALLDGACDIAPASRSLNDDEVRLAKSRGLTLRVHTIGYYGIAVIVHRDNPVRSLADHQVRDIFTGVFKNWSAVRGSDAPIVTHISVPEAGTYLGFQELAMDRRPYRADAVAHESYADIAAAVAKDPNAIGYVAMSMASGPAVRAVKINGVPATPISVSDDQYPYARLLRFYTNKDRESLAAREFIRYVRSRQGQNVVEDAGFVRRFQRHLSFGMETP